MVAYVSLSRIIFEQASKMKKIIFLFLTIILSSCSSFEDDEVRNPIPVDSILVNNISNLTADFTATIFCGSYCWKNTFFEKSVNGSNVYIKTFAVSDGSAVCPEVCVEVETPIIISLPTSGSYKFHFWKSDTSSIDTTIVF